MKNLIISIMCLLTCVAACAKPRCRSFNNYDDKVTIIFTDDKPGKRYTISDVKLVTSGREYKATSVKASIKDGMVEVTVTFPHLTQFSNPKVRLRVNGKKTRFNVCH
ncbi:MAG: hypothetical protein HDR90_02860 [Bacteroides sp.]|nr:hypothetical protein [Bacteroides sp.]